MATTREVEKKIKDLNWNLYDIAEWGIDREDELVDEIRSLQEEIANHECA